MTEEERRGSELAHYVMETDDAVNVNLQALWSSSLLRVALQSELSWFMYNVDHSQIVYVYHVQ
jgi:hypothetical protein